MGAKLDGFYGDCAVTVPVGAIAAEAAELLRVTEESLFHGIDAVKPGARVSLPLNLEEYPSRSDLEVYLSTLAQRGGLAPAATAAPQATAQLELGKPAAGALTVPPTSCPLRSSRD